MSRNASKSGWATAGLIVFFYLAVGLGQPFHEYQGAIHIHSVYSDGSGTIEFIAEEAARSGLDFIIMTDHDTLKPLTDGKQKYYGDVLVLIATELALPAGHCLALNISEVPDRRNAQAAVAAVNAQGGMVFLAHPLSAEHPWRDWGITGVAGMEVMNLGKALGDQEEAVRKRALFYFLTLRGGQAEEWLLPAVRVKPQAELAKWDELMRSRPFVGIGGVDSHANARFAGRRLRLPPYHAEFNMVRTHVLASQPFNRDVAHDAALIYAALKAGHCYVRFPVLRPPGRLSFIARSGEKMALMGDTVTLTEGLTLEATTPPSARQRLSLLKDGKVILEKDNASFAFQVQERGVYRVEAYAAEKPGGELSLWALSNPIYVK